MSAEKFRDICRIPSARLPNRDYTQNGYYFVTIVTRGRYQYFGEIVDGKMELSKIGQIANDCWRQIPAHFSHVELDSYIIMPNHVHGILYVETRHGASLQSGSRKFGPLQKNSIPLMINHFKGAVKRHLNKINIPFSWQERFHDRIIRKNNELERIRWYINNNVELWARDRNNRYD